MDTPVYHGTLTDPRWIPCSERLPEPSTYVLIWYRASYPGWRVSIGEISCGHWRPEGGNGNFDNDITHWMPLPGVPATPEGVAVPNALKTLTKFSPHK